MKKLLMFLLVILMLMQVCGAESLSRLEDESWVVCMSADGSHALIMSRSNDGETGVYFCDTASGERTALEGVEGINKVFAVVNDRLLCVGNRMSAYILIDLQSGEARILPQDGATFAGLLDDGDAVTCFESLNRYGMQDSEDRTYDLSAFMPKDWDDCRFFAAAGDPEKMLTVLCVNPMMDMAAGGAGECALARRNSDGSIATYPIGRISMSSMPETVCADGCGNVALFSAQAVMANNAVFVWCAGAAQPMVISTDEAGCVISRPVSECIDADGFFSAGDSAGSLVPLGWDDSQHLLLTDVRAGVTYAYDPVTGEQIALDLPYEEIFENVNGPALSLTYGMGLHYAGRFFFQASPYYLDR